LTCTSIAPGARPPAEELSRLLSYALLQGNEARARDLAHAVVVEASKTGAAQSVEDVLAQARATIAEHAAADQRIAAGVLDDGVRLVRGDRVAVEPIRWVWPGWLAAGKLHLLAGAPGTGKTTIALSLAATITRKGTRYPDGAINATARDVLIWSGEDDAGDTLVPRLLAMGADLQHVHFVGAVMDDGKPRPFDPSIDVRRLLVAAVDLAVGLVIVDPVVLTVRGDSHKNAETRRGLQPLVDLATTLDCAVVGISHYSKATQGRDPVERVNGSIAFGAVARIVLGTARRPGDQGGGAIIVRAKSNIGPDGGGFAYDIEPATVEAKVGAIETTSVRWGAPLDGTARDLLASAEPQPDAEHSERRDGESWLVELLAEGALPAREVERLAREAGFAWRTIQRAAKSASVSITRSGFGKACRTLWTLPVAPVAPSMNGGASGACAAVPLVEANSIRIPRFNELKA
jgi:DNA polymerase III delta prime subunit